MNKDMTKSKCSYRKRVERWFDGEHPDADGVIAAHVAACGVCSRYLAFLKEKRAAIGVGSEEGAISDGQFPAYWSGIDAQLGGRRYSRYGHRILAMASLGCAALISTFALMSIYGTIGGGPAPVAAETEFITYDTELPGAQTSVMEADGVQTLMVDMGDYDYGREEGLD